MNQPAATNQPEIPNTATNSDSPIEQSTDYQEEINKLLLAVEKFRKSGQVEESEVAFAKEKILPKLGYSRQQIDQLGPIGIMVKLQEEADKKSLTSKGSTSTQNQQNQTPTKQQPVNGQSETDLVKQVVDMTDNLSSEIDQEIKRQLEEKKSLEQAQEKVDNVLAQHEELNPSSSKKVNDTLRPTIGLFHTKAELDNEASNSVADNNNPSPSLGTANDSSTEPTDPLTASINFALNSLKEGDRVGNDWVLRKILTTSFGNKKSPFYELVNQSGASWTLSPEEMRDVLRSSIFSENKTLVKEIKGEQPEPLHNLGPETSTENQQVANQDSSNYQLPEAQTNNQDPREIKDRETSENEAEPEIQTETNPETIRLSPKQIEFLNKIHSDPNLWSTFITFSPANWKNFNNLYEQGDLHDIGIDAHPLLDKLNNSQIFNLMEVRNDDSSSKLLAEAGYSLSSTADNPEIFAVHIIANHKLLSDLASKMKASGLASANLPSTKDVINLAIAAKNGNSESLFKLVEALNFLPVGSKFKVVKTNQFETLKKYFNS